MPDLEHCSQCGKHVLTSRYSWSKTLIICRTCEEFNIQKHATKQYSEADERSLTFKRDSNLEFGKSKSKFSSSAKSQFFEDEILVTWSSLLKICFGGLLIASMFTACVLFRNKNIKSRLDVTPSINNINSNID